MRKNANITKVVSYLRLSKDDGDKVESDSISNQRDLIRDYISKRDDLELVDEYVDDGFSGSNFERPSFKKMIEDMKTGNIDCLIVKDLSRFGRNYIEAGRYLERVFPFLGVRFISILDNYDSNQENNASDQIIIPFKNLINDSYCRDISNKVRSQLDIKRKSGKFIGSFSSYGYIKDPYDKNHLIIDPVAADIVRLIFNLKLDGHNSDYIAKKLNEMGVLPPAEYKRSNGMNYDTGFRTGKSGKWRTTTVARILNNEIYTGTMVQGTKKKVSYRIKKSRVVPKEDWIRVENTHEAIISRALFDETQRMMLRDTRTSPVNDSVYVLSGIVKCASCGQNMIRKSVNKKDKIYHYLCCTTNKSGLGCTPHMINEEALKSVVLLCIQKQIALLLNSQAIVEQIDFIPHQQSSIKVIDQQLISLTEQIERYKSLKTSAYTDFLEKRITEDDFNNINEAFSNKCQKALDQKKDLLNKKERLLSKANDLKPWIQSIKDYRNITELTRSVVVALIDDIVIHSKDSIEIVFRYGDEMQELIGMANIGEED